MPYERLINVASFDDLLEEIRNFANDTGDWSLHRDLTGPSEGVSSGGRELVMENGDVLVGLRSTTTGGGANRLRLFDGIPPYSGSGIAIDTLNNNSGIRVSESNYSSGSGGRVTQPAFAGPFPTAFLFTNSPSTYIHVAVEVIAGRYRHIWFGNMRKFGTWTGGGYYGATYWDQGANFIDNPNYGGHAVPMDQSSWTTFHYEGLSPYIWRAGVQEEINGVSRRLGVGSSRGGFGTAFRNIQATPFSGLIALQPITAWSVNTADAPDTTRCVGQILDVAEVNMRNLQPGQDYFIGSDQWIVFPLVQKGEPSARLDVENSGYYGYAYRVVP